MPHDRLTTTLIISTYLIRSVFSWNHEFRALESEHRASLRNAHGMFQSCYIVLKVVYFRIFGILPTRWVICRSLLECNAVRQTYFKRQKSMARGNFDGARESIRPQPCRKITVSISEFHLLLSLCLRWTWTEDVIVVIWAETPGLVYILPCNREFTFRLVNSNVYSAYRPTTARLLSSTLLIISKSIL